MAEVVSIVDIGEQRKEAAWYAFETAAQNFVEAFLEYQVAYGRNGEDRDRFAIAAGTLHGATDYLTETIANYETELARQYGRREANGE